ncbi:MAG: hypothetical protein A2655_00530 [Candidatus Yanofskybacteria bacterium RIFCSPHIGHO2_01_FULL_43_42]|uniref:Thioredoxin domain-containing protein n=1 Tax=Candidatus Yanofskybacteria bacterium RIFCSPLOWO2_01_FULL_43_22 TaxID=1802695 RepID=A0A1F8GG34_9BACT|nr:MAG: hypothetical protein A2655_00530 [Candidatus Yanofskybacteria bacterium RIFCSPHIGHO2_01_FULL_43_42]OGN13742.1 MAG: hypothetical protein A3D48_00280 [Candidatus Yanofskybacteria bacterium RIFCSPHIGHO2_02_FULL_43_17]OGN24261.1 MAG: hypothetical protein A3A13_03725 [Candidatus Yanofskybacteria bacterium RIFCSPLOWO2_01_FULL_43_22]
MDEQLTKKERRELRRQEKESERSNVVQANKTKKYFVRGFILLAFVAVVFGFWKLSQRAPVIADAEVLAINELDWIRGDKDSAVTLIEYLDFQCPACGVYHPWVTQLFSEYGDRVRFATRHFPIINIHPNAMPAAKATEAAGKQKKFWEMHNLLFENQRNWSNERNPIDLFLSYAEDIGLDKDKFLADYKDGSIDDKIDSDRNGALRAGVTGTPTFFLNGKKINNPKGYEEFKTLIEKELGISN